MATIATCEIDVVFNTQSVRNQLNKLQSELKRSVSSVNIGSDLSNKISKSVSQGISNGAKQGAKELERTLKQTFRNLSLVSSVGGFKIPGLSAARGGMETLEKGQRLTNLLLGGQLAGQMLGGRGRGRGRGLGNALESLLSITPSRSNVNPILATASAAFAGKKLVKRIGLPNPSINIPPPLNITSGIELDEDGIPIQQEAAMRIQGRVKIKPRRPVRLPGGRSMFPPGLPPEPPVSHFPTFGKGVDWLKGLPTIAKVGIAAGAVVGVFMAIKDAADTLPEDFKKTKAATDAVVSGIGAFTGAFKNLPGALVAGVLGGQKGMEKYYGAKMGNNIKSEAQIREELFGGRANVRKFSGLTRGLGQALEPTEMAWTPLPISKLKEIATTLGTSRTGLEELLPSTKGAAREETLNKIKEINSEQRKIYNEVKQEEDQKKELRLEKNKLAEEYAYERAKGINRPASIESLSPDQLGKAFAKAFVDRQNEQKSRDEELLKMQVEYSKATKEIDQKLLEIETARKEYDQITADSTKALLNLFDTALKNNN